MKYERAFPIRIILIIMAFILQVMIGGLLGLAITITTIIATHIWITKVIKNNYANGGKDE